MADIKCSRCGAIIPEDASFCPGCGAPKPVEQPSVSVKAQPEPEPEPAPAPTPQPVYKPKPNLKTKTSFGISSILDKFLSKTFIILGAFLGILLVWIGAIIILFASEHSSSGLFVGSTGLIIIGELLIFGGLWNKQIDKYVRLAMILIGGYIIASIMSIVLGLSSVFSSFSIPF
jgi:hypothetical protein